MALTTTPSGWVESARLRHLGGHSFYAQTDFLRLRFGRCDAEFLVFEREDGRLQGHFSAVSNDPQRYRLARRRTRDKYRQPARLGYFSAIVGPNHVAYFQSCFGCRTTLVDAGDDGSAGARQFERSRQLGSQPLHSNTEPSARDSAF